MNKRILIIASLLAIFCLTIAGLAFARSSASTRTAMSCDCCKGDSCPMKSKGASANEKMSCCDDCDCCKGDSCPVKRKDGDKSSMKDDMNKADAAKDCSCSCCHHDKDTEKTAPGA